MDLFAEIRNERYAREDRLREAILECIEEFGEPTYRITSTYMHHENEEEINRMQRSITKHFASEHARAVMDAWIKACT